MLSERSILCPVDFSEQSRQALLWASAIAKHREVEMTVLTVVEPLLAAAGLHLGFDLKKSEVLPALHEFVAATLPEGAQTSRVRVVVRVGDPSEEILQTARALKAELIVMGTHGLGGWRKLLLGSTTEQVLRRTEWPILAVPAGAISAPTMDHPSVQLRKILVATDFRDSAAAATQWASDLASDINVPLVLAHVVEPIIVPPPWHELVPDLESERFTSAQRMLARLSATFPIAQNHWVVSLGSPADTIASLAVEHEAGLVVMGLANVADAESRKPGSIAYRVLRLAHVAVVVVPGSVAQPALDRASQVAEWRTS